MTIKKFVVQILTDNCEERVFTEEEFFKEYGVPLTEVNVLSLFQDGKLQGEVSPPWERKVLDRRVSLGPIKDSKDKEKSIKVVQQVEKDYDWTFTEKEFEEDYGAPLTEGNLYKLIENGTFLLDGSVDELEGDFSIYID
jgi:hypothetical protein